MERMQRLLGRPFSLQRLVLDLLVLGAAFVLAQVLTGCARPAVLFRHPQTGHLIECQRILGWEEFNAEAHRDRDQCLEEARRAGYVEVPKHRPPDLWPDKRNLVQ